MREWKVEDFDKIRNFSSVPSKLKTHIDSMLDSTDNCNVNVENINENTGEYRIILQGTLKKGKRNK